ncbi:hypothetical protein DL766_004488 [Monosporascus sp. MC13-8B]|uniref:DUF1330 domain-containing protein n=1 Tax=Monosporascus cannonballus TaxID=155416 RepID=A0ABY0H3H2_9PEZI|nr:hypothetical protein DL762_007183 [Monosporascus cannonballus]RYO86135.1 hypothetical protein DL763_006828 [Monosporascus cannonballus]RYP31180.1 hypothetical protein DL766_004488 [Monosporascus sp. MC13-8B]
MVLCGLHLIGLEPGRSVELFLLELRQKGSTGHLLARNIHRDLLVLDAEAVILGNARAKVHALWSASCGVSSPALVKYAENKSRLLNPEPGSVEPPVPHETTPSESSQNLEVSPELSDWISSLPGQLRDHPVSMLNLPAFNPGKKDQYRKYGAEFSARVGSRYGGRVKIVGKVAGGRAMDDGWDEIAFVHYPSVQHFAAMAASKDYQEINREYRLGALKDTFILCVVEQF